uniref:Kinetochore associated 1 n=1 Tax=Varanus komodoensis TaxID=61221 RepID=A0A8D2LLE8_VARKO
MWNNVEFLTSDDTGSGQLSIHSRQECGSTLYQMNALIKVAASEKVLSNPELYAGSSGAGCVVAVDRTVLVLDSICQSLQLCIQFEAEVDVVGLCQEGQFLVAGERSGNLHLIHVSSKQTLLTNVCHLFNISQQGSLPSKHVPERTEYFLRNKRVFLKCVCLLKGLGDCVLSVWEVNPSKKWIAIQNVNVLSLWDVYSLTLIWNCPTVDIEEFLLTSESDSSAVSRQGIASLKLVALTKPENNKQMRNIVVFSLPAMHQLYSLEVTNTSSLVQSGINTVGLCRILSSDVPISFLVMRCLTEALPENRLSRLLHKHKFTEAENFAVQFGLEIELVYKVKVSSILEKLVTESTAGGGQAAWLDLVAQAKETLNKIKDNQFVLEYCINMPWPTYETAQEMLYYARSRDYFPDMYFCPSQVLRAQAKLTTFYGAFGLEKYSGTAWIEFLNNQNIFKEILSQLKEGNLSCAQYLWLRHQADFKSDFSMDMLDDLLSTVRTAVSRKELCRWFKDVVIPFVRQVIPHGQRKIAKWLEQGARNLELTDKANWPENGLEMAQVFFNSKAPGEIGLASSCHWRSLEYWNWNFPSLLPWLVSALQGLVDLYRKYNCRLALCDFEKQNANAIVFRMLDKVLAAELIPATLEKYIEPYMCHRNLEKDEILLQYIKDLLQRYCTRSTSVLDTTWEAKAIAVLGCMSNIDVSLAECMFALFCRVLYLLQLHPVDYSLRILYECTVSAVSPIGVNQLTFAHRSRALRCLLCLADPRAVEALFKKPVKKVKHFLKCLIHLTVLENLNIPYTYESFHSAPKEGLIKGLWKNHSHEPTAVKLVTELSLEYSVYNAQLWNGLLQKLISFNMIPYLRKVLAEITGIYSLWQVREIFNLCPVLADLDLTAIARQYSKTGQTALALGCLLLMPQPEKRSEQIQVSDHTGRTLCSLSHCRHLIRSLILDYIMNKKYEEFANPKYFPLLNLPEMGPDRMKGLVEKLVNKNR